MLLPAWPATAHHDDPIPPHPGVSAADVSTILLTLARGEADLLTLVSPLHTGAQKASLPRDVAERVRDPPPLDATLAALASTFGAPPASAPPLPPEIERALSSLGQGVLAAEALRAGGDPYAAGLALRDGYARALPILERDTILLAWPDAYSGLALDPTRAEQLARGARHARSTSDALALAGIPEAGPVETKLLPEALASLYLRLGLPVDRETLAGIHASLALDPVLRRPLEDALAHLERAVVLRDDAFRDVASEQLGILFLTPQVDAALRAPSPTHEQLALLASYGLAIDRIDRERMLQAAAHLARASDFLLAVPVDEAPLPCCTGEARPTDEGTVRLGVGGVMVEGRASGEGDVRVWLGEGDALPDVYSDARVALDQRRLSLIVYRDADGDLAADAGESLFATPPLADPENDVRFQDPYGLVVVSGERSTRTDARFGNKTIEILWPGAASLPAPGSEPLYALDGILSESVPFGAWPVLTEAARRALESDVQAPSRVLVTVNPASYQILRWDLGGDDQYLTNAAGAGTRGLVRIEANNSHAALRENATAGPLPATLLVDSGGNDVYRTRGNDTLASSNASVALLADRGGRDAYVVESGRGLATAGAAGVALLFAGTGNTTYDARDASIVRAAAGATVVLHDASGNDRYRAGNQTLAASDLGELALLLDTEGNDAYRSAAFSQAASRGGAALLLDASGNDTYDAGGRADAQGYAERYPASGLPCALPVSCPEIIGPARLAILLDAGGRDEGACPPGGAANAIVGRIGIGRAPSDPFNPAAGFCAQIDPDPLLPADDGSIEIPPTFFASSLASFSVPGLVRFGGLGNDTVLDPYVLNVDVLGNDTYAIGAAARANADAAPKLGWLAPVSLHVDTDGNDTHDARLDEAKIGGQFGYASGGVALHATTSTLRFSYAPDPKVDASAPRLENGTLVGGPSAGADNTTIVGSPYHTHRYRNVTTGLAAAERGGVAILLRDGVAIDVASADAAFTCRLACARTGGVALALGTGPGDAIAASPWSLGAVHENELGGMAVYYKRGGRDAYSGTNLSMGHVARVPADPRNENAIAPLAQRRPNVALFVDDGYERDVYATPLNWTRGNNRFWEDQPTIASFHAFGDRSLHVAQGYDNLDWYANANLAAADEGVAEDTGPGTNGRIETPLGPAPPLYETWLGACLALPPNSAPRNNCWSLLNASTPVVSTYNSTFRSGGNLRVPLGVERGDGGSATTPDGVRPVTFARTLFNPTVEIVNVSYVGETGLKWITPAEGPRVADTTHVRIRALDPPAFADQTLVENALDRPTSSATTLHRGRSIQRVELSVLGREPWWNGCPVETMRDRHDARACLVAHWDRDEHEEWPDATDPVHRWNSASRSDFQATFHAGETLPGLPGGPLFPPGNYTLVARAYAARPHGLPSLAGQQVQLGVLQGLTADAFNLTDDNYGLYGSAYFVDVPFLNKPRLLPGGSIRDFDRVTPAVYEVNVSEPVRYSIDILSVTEHGVVRERHPVNGTRLSQLYNDTAIYHARGYDTIRFEWKPQGRPSGKYALYLNMTGKLTNATSNATSPTQFLYIDDEAPWIGVDARGMPAALNASNSPGGVVTLTTNSTQLIDPNAPIRRIDIWVQEDILDAADPNVVLESRPWRHAGTTNGLTAGDRIDRSTGEVAQFGIFHFQAEPEPGPPRRYSFAVYHTDRAGNRVVGDPTAAVPPGPDCYHTYCATFLYDITPPRTRLESVDPAPAVGRVGAGNVMARVRSEETPDVATQISVATLLDPHEERAFDAALLGAPIAPAPRVTAPNVTVFLDPGERSLAPTSGFLRANAGIEAHVRVKAGASHDDAFSLELGPPLHLVARVLDVAGKRVVAGPWEIDVTDQLPLTPSGDRQLSGTVNGSVRVPITTPATSGVYILSIVARSPAYANHTSFAELREGFVVWDALPAPDANGTIEWPPPREKLQHGNAAILLTRAVDRAGNVEEKGSYDVRLGVDLLPPNLTAEPIVEATSHAVSVRVELDEPALADLTILATDGRAVANAALPTASNVHAATISGLLPETNYTLRLDLADELGNARNLTRAFRTGRMLDTLLDPPHVLIADAQNVTLRVQAETQTRVEHALELSTDGGRSYEHLVGRTRATEIGSSTRTFLLDPAAFPESGVAQLRVTTTLLDAANLTTRSYSPLFTLDGHAPRLSFSADHPLDVPTADAITLFVSATDNASGLARLERARAGGPFAPLAGSNLTLEGSEPETILLRAIDRAGHASNATSVRLPFDRMRPRLDAQADAGTTTSLTVIPVRVTARDEHSAIRDVVARDAAGEAFRIDGRDLAAGGTVALYAPGEQEGPRVLSLTATDLAGNTANATLTLRVDRTAPSASFRILERSLDRLVIETTFDERARIAATLSGPDGARLLPAPMEPSSHLIIEQDGLQPGAEYRLIMRASDAAGNAADVTRAFNTRRDVTPPAPTDAPTATPLPDGSILLDWAPARDDGRVAAYHVLRADANGELALIATATATRHVDVQARLGATYRYAVVAMDAGGNLAGPSPEALGRSTTSPRVTDHATSWSGGALLVEARIEDADGDRPNVTWHAGDLAVPLELHADGSGWIARARVDAPVLDELAVLRHHLVADDGTFSTRWPPASDAIAPPRPSVEADEGGPLVAAAKRVPGGLAIALVAVALAAAFRRRA